VTVRRAILVALAAAGALCAGAVTAAGAKAPVTVRLGEYFYRSRVVTVHVGQRVRFLNVGKIEHTVADTDRHGNIRSRVIHPRPLEHGASQTVVFRRAGIVHYVCTFHPTLMKGVVRVVR